MRTIEIAFFALVAVAGAAVGGVGLWLHFDQFVLQANDSAEDVRLRIARVKEMGAGALAFQKGNARPPTSRDLNCKTKSCGKYQVWLWKATPEPDGTFTIRYTAPGATPKLPPRYLTWYSRDGSTDLDNYEKPWQWYVRFIPWAVFDLAVIALPWIAFALWRRRKRRAELRGDTK